jgi:hypothetical protein
MIYVEDGTPPTVRFTVEVWNVNYATIDSSKGEWHIVTGTYDEGTNALEIYQDGVKGTGATNASTHSKTNADCAIGAHFASFNREHDGPIILFMAHNRALSEDEIASLHRDPYQFLIPA